MAGAGERRRERQEAAELRARREAETEERRLREVGLDEGEAVGEREGQLRDRVRAGFGNVISRNAHRIKIANLLFDKVLLNIAHHFQSKGDRKKR